MVRKLALICLVATLWALVIIVAVNIIKKTFSSQEFVSIFQKSADSILSYEMKPNFSKVLSHLNTKITYQTNSQGFRDSNFILKNDPKVSKIVVLGDSVAFGIGIEFDQTFGKLLEKELPSIQVYNFGVVGYNTIQEFELFTKTVLPYHPNIIILVYSLNDASLEKDWEYKPDSKRIGLKSDVNISEEMLLYEKIYKLENGPWQQRRQYLLQMKNLAQSYNAKFLIVIPPLAFQISNPQQSWVSQQTVSEFFAQNGIAYLDLLPTFLNSKQNANALFLDESHPSVLGNQIIAQEIIRALQL